ncbi:MAG: 16S rRNA (guanine(966)-N(2))-methyltransferase RsmD [Actinomycetota bacterium]
MRIVAGQFGGRRLSVPEGNGTRPTSDRVREAIFAQLAHDGWLTETRVLDLYAGTGALAIEAISRGARTAVAVEVDRIAARTIQENLTRLGPLALAAVRVHIDLVERMLGVRPGAEGPYDLVFIDPPYGMAEESLGDVLTLLLGWLSQHALIVVERGVRAGPPPWPPEMSPVRDRRYGDTMVWVAEYRRPA